MYVRNILWIRINQNDADPEFLQYLVPYMYICIPYCISETWNNLQKGELRQKVVLKLFPTQ